MERAERNRIIVERHMAGELLSEIARDYGITRQWAHYIVRRAGVPKSVTQRNYRRWHKETHSVERVEFQCPVCGTVEHVTPYEAETRVVCSRECRDERRRYDDEELLDHLRDLADELGRTPGQHDIIEADGPGHTTYYAHFGSLRAAQELAGLEPNKHGDASRFGNRAEAA